MSVIWFFFSSRRRHTRWNCDWSSTCALPIFGGTLLHDSVGSHVPPDDHGREPGCGVAIDPPHVGRQQRQRDQLRSEERRVGKECRSRWAEYREKEKRK